MSKFFNSNSQEKGTDECAIYFVTFLVDLFPGLVIIFMLSKLYDNTFEKCGCKKLISGNYIRDVGGVAIVSYGVYWVQVFLWLSITLFSKLLLIIVELNFIKPFTFFARISLKIF